MIARVRVHSGTCLRACAFVQKAVGEVTVDYTSAPVLTFCETYEASVLHARL